MTTSTKPADARTASSASTTEPGRYVLIQSARGHAAVEAWLRAPSSQHPGSTNADALGIDEEYFGRGEGGFLSTVDDLLYAWPPGLTRRGDIRDVLLWLIPDGDVLDQAR